MITGKGLRRITVDGHAYVWKVGHGTDPDENPRAVVIADASRTGSILTLPDPRGSLPYPGCDHGAYVVTPALIAERIRLARSMGWAPGEGRGVFVCRGAQPIL